MSRSLSALSRRWVSLSNIFKTVSLAWTGAPVKASATVEISSAKEGYRPSSTDILVYLSEDLKVYYYLSPVFSLNFLGDSRFRFWISPGRRGGGGWFLLDGVFLGHFLAMSWLFDWKDAAMDSPPEEEIRPWETRAWKRTGAWSST